MPKRQRPRSKAYIREHPIHPVYLVPIVLIIILVPLIVRANLFELSEASQLYWPDDVYVDFFSYYKSIWFTVLTFISAAMTLYLYWTKRILLESLLAFWPLFIYFALVVISYLFADPKSIATAGYMGSYQGLFVMLGYGIIVMVVAFLITDESHMRLITSALITVGVVVFFIGASQYFGRDFFNTSLGQTLIFPSSLESLQESMEIRFGQNDIYATMYNTNFVGSFAALMIPFSFALFMRVRHWVHTPLLMVFFAGMVFIAFGSNSRAGIVGIGASFIVILAMFRKMLLRHPIKFVIPFLLMGSTGYILDQVSDGRIEEELRSLSIRADYERSQERFIFDEVSVHDKSIVIDSEEEGMVILHRGTRPLAFETLEGERLDAHFEDNTYGFDEGPYEPFEVQLRQQGEIRVTAYGESFTAYMVQEGFRTVDVFGNVTVPGESAHVGWMAPYGAMFSNRVLIWAHSIPLLGDAILIGEGPDMFTTAFPNDDITLRMNGMSENALVDKPHNMYLQIGTNIGVVGLLALMIFFIRYVYDSLKLYIHGRFHTFAEFLGVGLLSSVIAYLVTGFFNDQRISVAPLFYIMLGLGIAVNAYNRRKSLQ